LRVAAETVQHHVHELIAREIGRVNKLLAAAALPLGAPVSA
jgi:hypothetical protein